MPAPRRGWSPRACSAPALLDVVQLETEVGGDRQHQLTDAREHGALDRGVTVHLDSFHETRRGPQPTPLGCTSTATNRTVIEHIASGAGPGALGGPGRPRPSADRGGGARLGGA